jgi:hypothetical protein
MNNRIPRLKLLCVFSLLLASGQAFAMGAPKPTASDPQWNVPGITLKYQEYPEWCWAATAQAVLSTRMAQAPSQCQIVSTALEQDCCTNRRAPGCDRPYYPEIALSLYGVETHEDSSLDFQAVISNMQAGLPVILVVKNGDGTEHAVVATGAYQTGGQYYLDVFDPIYGPGRWSLKYLDDDRPWANSLFLGAGRLR